MKPKPLYLCLIYLSGNSHPSFWCKHYGSKIARDFKETNTLEKFNCSRFPIGPWNRIKDTIHSKQERWHQCYRLENGYGIHLPAASLVATLVASLGVNDAIKINIFFSQHCCQWKISRSVWIGLNPCSLKRNRPIPHNTRESYLNALWESILPKNVTIEE